MKDPRRTSAAFSPTLLVLGVTLLAFGLTGCYTQLKTADPAPRTQTGPRMAQEQTEAKPSSEEPTYANEYRREYRTDDSAPAIDDYGYGGTTYGASDYLYEYKYQYKYKYGSPYQYRSRYGGWCDDAFFHDPWYYDSWCGPSYGSRFSLSFHFGSPYYSYRPWGHRYYSSWYGYGYGGRPYSNYNFGTQYYYYGDVDRDEDDRTYGPRRATIGRGTTNAGLPSTANRSTARTAASTNQGVHSSSSGGRIGRSSEASNPRQGRVGRTASDRSARSWDVERPARTSTDGRIGRSRSATERDTRTRQAQPDRSRTTRARTDDRSARTRDGERTRTRRRSSDDDGQRYRVSPPRSQDVQRRNTDRTRNRAQTRTRSDNSSSNARSRSTNSRSSDRARSSSRDRSRSESSSSSRSRSRSSDDDDGR